MIGQGRGIAPRECKRRSRNGTWGRVKVTDKAGNKMRKGKKIGTGGENSG
jgi:hypothetical protein